MMNTAAHLLGLAAFLSVSFVQASEISGTDLVSGKKFTQASNSKATAVIFLSAKCPCSASHEKILNEMAKKYSAQGIQFVGVHSNQNETPEEAKLHFKEFTFPVIEDSKAKIANEMKALKTPHAFLIQNGKTVFEGGVDDSADAAEAKTHYLANAIEELNQGKPITVAKARALGCQIKR